jgi:hypothetical protein
MKHLPKTGQSLVAPCLTERELKLALDELGAAAAYDEASIHQLYLKLAAVYGAWFAQEAAKHVTPVAQALRKAGADLREVVTLFSGHETGFRTGVEIEAASQLKRILALDPTVGSIDAAYQSVHSLVKLAEKVSHACLEAYVELTNGNIGGRDKLDWYDNFTALLLEIASRVGIKPSLNKDRETGLRGGWLLKAAQTLEPFLDPHMRSPSPEACGKRLERSRKRLLNAHRQNPPSR